MDLAVIIAAHNAARWIGEQLDALKAESWDGGEWEVVVVDNRSSDDTAALVKARAEEWDALRIMSAHARGNKHYAINSVIHELDANRFAIVDADDIIAPGWVAAMGDGLAEAEIVTGPLELDRLNLRGWPRHAAAMAPPNPSPFWIACCRSPAAATSASRALHSNDLAGSRRSTPRVKTWTSPQQRVAAV